MIGKSLGHYQVTGKLGAGGMGEVYRARDTRLGRDVAIKSLPPAFAQDRERLARFEREAQVLASLNHPNIAAIYGLEESDGRPYLVLELVEGPTLAERIAGGPMSLEDAVEVARQICDALEVAHERGIVHRDLKPANIKVTLEGKVKVLDFGLAKAFTDDTAGSDYSRSPTISLAATRAGVILGTAAYMSPEQARGRQVDRRTDVWAFGCVLYEMLAGRQAFGGDDLTDVIAAIVRSEPDWNALPASTPPRVRELLRRCIQKDLSRRLRDIGDVRLELDEALAAPIPQVAAVAAAPPRPRRLLVLLLVAGLISATAAGVAVWVAKPIPRPAAREPKRLSVQLPLDQTLMVGGIALSPDGTRLVYSDARSAQGRQLYLRSMDQLDIKPIRGTENSLLPTFSPDGQWVLFFASGQLRKVSVNGGTSQVLCAASQGRGASWGPNDTILFGTVGSGLMQVSAAGGKAEPATKLEPDKGERAHRWPQVLPGGKAVLFSIATGGGGDTDRIAVQVLATGERRILVEGGSNPRYAGGYLVFIRAGTLLAAPFDIERLRIGGTPVPVAEGIGGSISTGAYYATADDGTLAYVPGGFGQKYTLVWVDRKGASRTVPAAPAFFHDIRLSPDGKRLAVNMTTDGRPDLWVYDLVRDTLTRVTFEGAHSHAWHPDGKRLAYGSLTGRGLFWKAADGSTPEEKLVESQSTNLSPTSWSPDGRVLAFNENNAETRLDITLLRLDGDRKAQPFLKTAFDEGGAMFSPGAEPRYIAYQSNETGRYEVYVQPYPGPGGKWQVSTDGGVEPVWASSGRELLYRNGDKVMAVDVQTRPTFSASRPKLLFEGRYLLGRGLYPYWDVAPDGQHFLMIKSEDDAGQAQLHVVVDWLEELRRRVPAGKN